MHLPLPGSSMPGQVKSAPSEQSIVQPFLFKQSAESVGSQTPGCDILTEFCGRPPIEIIKFSELKSGNLSQSVNLWNSLVKEL